MNENDWLGDSWWLVRSLIFASIVAYFIFDHFEKKRIRDEREDLIHLKSLELTNKVSITALSALVCANYFWPTMPALIPILVLVIGTLYGEVLGKIFFRKKY